MTAPRRTKPGKTLVEFHTMETFGTLDDMRERTHHVKYVVDADGFFFKRFVRDDGAPTRWTCLRGPKKDETSEDLLTRVALALERARQRADRGVVTIWKDNR